MSSARTFPHTSERVNGVSRSMVRVTCRKCGVSSSIDVMPPNIVTKKLEQRGWVIGANDQWDLCPACALKDKKPPALKVVPDSSLSPAAQPPRVMSREDRRLIFEKLNEVYLDEARGYDSGWSDHRVATDMGVPRKWVETVRSEMFGDNGANAEMSTFLLEAENTLADARKMLAEARQHRETAEAILKDAMAAGGLNQISDRISKLEKLAAEVRKLVLVP